MSTPPPELLALPAQGSTSWYPYAKSFDDAFRLVPRPTLHRPEDYGAAGNGTTDDQAALGRMLAALKRGDHVLLAGSYRKSDVLEVPVPETVWRQYGTLISVNTQRAAVRLGPAAWGTSWRNLRNEVDWAGVSPVRGGTDVLTAGLAAWDTHSLDLDGVHSVLSRQCGIYLSTVVRSRLRDLTVHRSQADSIHMTHACEDLDLERMRVTYSGDDALAVVSYLRRGSGPNDPEVGPCRRIRARGLHARYSHARGATILGGQDCEFKDLDIAWTRAAGCYMGSESGYQTHSATRSVMRGGVVADVGYPIPPSGSTTDDSALDHGHLFFLSQQAGAPVTDCAYEDFEVSGGGDPVYNFTRAITNNSATYSGCAYRRIRARRGRERSAGIALGGSTAGVAYERLIDVRGA